MTTVHVYLFMQDLCLCCRGDDLPKIGLLMVVLGLIFMSDRVITECKYTI